MIEYKLVTPEAVEHIAANLREVDARELWDSTGRDALGVLRASVSAATRSRIALFMGTPIAIFGVNAHPKADFFGIPWMVGTPEMDKHPRELISDAARNVNVMHKMFPVLGNFVSAQNPVSIRWLERLGFTIEESRPFGFAQKPFHYFHRHV